MKIKQFNGQEYDEVEDEMITIDCTGEEIKGISTMEITMDEVFNIIKPKVFGELKNEM